MPPAFTAEEQDRINRLLLEAGYRLFTTQGLRKTSLDELVGPAGIAKSSFYAFFDSKEALYVELMFQQLPEIRARLLDWLSGESLGTADAIRGFLRGVIDIQQNNPLYNRLVTHPAELEAVNRRVPQERLADAKEQVLAPILEFIERAQHAGNLIEADPAVVLGVLQAVLAVPIESRQFDPDVYPAVMDTLIDLVATGLTRPEHQRKDT